MIQSRHFGGLIRVMTRQSYTCKFPALAGEGVRCVQTMLSQKLWLRDVLPVTFNAWLGQWAVATGAEGVGSCCCQFLS